MVNLVINLFSFGTVLVHLFFAALILLFVFKAHTRGNAVKYYAFFQKWSLFFAFLVALGAALGSLFFSEIANYQPCTLCWWQRVFLYPQVVILGLALWRKDAQVKFYLIALSFVGAIIAGYQYLLTLLTPASPFGLCSAGVSCLTNYFIKFGYITSPLMSFTAFALIGLLLSVWRADNQTNNS